MTEIVQVVFRLVMITSAIGMPVAALILIATATEKKQ